MQSENPLQKIGRDREALRALAETVSKLSRRLKEVVGEKVPDPVLRPSLERLYKALEDVEEFTAKHRKRNKFLRMIHYASTVKDDVDRLKRNMDDAMAEIYGVALVSLNSYVGDMKLQVRTMELQVTAMQLQATAMQRTIDENAQYDGQFRLLRSSDIAKLELLKENEVHTEDGKVVVRYHRAKVSQESLVVRFVLGTPPEEPRVAGPTERKPYDEMSFRERMAYHDEILKDISTVEDSHPNIAEIYGCGTDPKKPFTLFKSGFLPYFVLWRKPGSFLTNAVHCTFKIQAAAAHLRTLGITWVPQLWPPSVRLDEHLEPIIGLYDDLYRSNSENDPVDRIEAQVLATCIDFTCYLSEPGQEREVSSADVRGALPGLINGRLDGVLGTRSAQRTRHIIFKCDFANRYTLSGDTVERLRSLVDHTSRDYRVSAWAWPQLLFMLSANSSHMHRSTMDVFHNAWGGPRTMSECFEIQCMGEDSERVVYDTYRIDIPHAQRQMFGVPSVQGRRGKTRIISISDKTYHIPE